jgi:DNA-binding MurR/RpiR family transcriptional regulator
VAPRDSSPLPISIVEHLEAQFATLSPALRKAARFAIDNPEEVAVNSMRTIARRAGVHHNAMVRVAREVGFDNYDAFRDCFRRIVMRARQPGWLDRAQTIRAHFPAGPNGRLIGQYVQQEIANIQQAFSEETVANLDRAIDLMRSARCTYVLGLRSLFPAAYYFHYVCRLFSDRFVLLTGTGGTFPDELRGVYAEDVLLAFSYRPYSKDSVQAVEFARNKGARIVSITDSKVSPVLGAGTLGFVVNNTSDSLFPTLLPALALAEVLATLLVSTGDSETLAEISRSQEQLDSFGVYVE